MSPPAMHLLGKPHVERDGEVVRGPVLMAAKPMIAEIDNPALSAMLVAGPA